MNPAISSEQLEAKESTTTRAPSILICDDEPNIRFAMRSILESEGYGVREAIHGVAAIESCLRRKPDVIVLDLSMPHLDGLSVLRELNMVLQPDPPKVIILTAYGSISACMQANELGAFAFLEKPITPDRLRTTIARALKGEPAETRDLDDSIFREDLDRFLN
jgi:DNA-binding NtrC family response regulator